MSHAKAFPGLLSGMGGLVTNGYCILEEPERAIKIDGSMDVEIARMPAMIHAVQVRAGILAAGRLPYDVTTVCGRQMPRSQVKPEISWRHTLSLHDQTAMCEVCQEKVGGAGV